MAQTNILIVDDFPQHTMALETVLNELEQNIIVAHSPDEALRQVLAHDFAVILLDVHMPIMNGFEVAKLIRSRKKSCYTPIIFLSAISKDDKNINEGYAMGAVDYVFKPINPTLLRSKVKVFVDLYTKSSLALNLQNELRLRKQAERETQKKQRQINLTEINRLITMEEITSAMAHELNQPLTAIQTYIQGCIHRIKQKNISSEKMLEVLSEVTKQTERAGNILHRIKSCIRKNCFNFEEILINDLLADLLPFLLETIKDENIHLTMDFSQTHCKVSLDVTQFEQVCLNLLLNAVEAFKTKESHERKITIETIALEREMIINFKDNGPGIPTENLKKLFDLYFTTKPKSLGVGLCICRTIIETHGGHITALPNPERGICFQITLPFTTP